MLSICTVVSHLFWKNQTSLVKLVLLLWGYHMSICSGLDSLPMENPNLFIYLFILPQGTIISNFAPCMFEAN